MIHNEQTKWDPDQVALKTLFNQYFGSDMNAVVFQELREARGLAYNAYARYAMPARKEDPEYFFAHVITQNDKMMDCTRQFHAILDTIPQSEASFRIAKEAVTKRIASQRTTKSAIIQAYLSAKRMGIDYDINRKVYEMLPSLTLQDVVDFSRRYIAGKPYRYVILGNEKELDIQSLEKIAPIKRLTTEEIFGE